MKTLIVILGIVLVGITTICPLGCARHSEAGTFAKYGFSFQYPAGYEVDERGVYRKGDANSDSSGSVILSKDGRAPFLLVWAADQEAGVQPDEGDLGVELGGYISDFEQAIRDAGGWMQVGETVEDSCSGHRMLRCYYVAAVWSGGTAVSGEVGLVCCSESRRSFMLYTRSSQKENEADEVDQFHFFSSSLVCH